MWWRPWCFTPPESGSMDPKIWLGHPWGHVDLSLTCWLSHFVNRGLYFCSNPCVVFSVTTGRPVVIVLCYFNMVHPNSISMIIRREWRLLSLSPSYTILNDSPHIVFQGDRNCWLLHQLALAFCGFSCLFAQPSFFFLSSSFRSMCSFHVARVAFCSATLLVLAHSRCFLAPLLWNTIPH